MRVICSIHSTHLRTHMITWLSRQAQQLNKYTQTCYLSHIHVKKYNGSKLKRKSYTHSRFVVGCGRSPMAVRVSVDQ